MKHEEIISKVRDILNEHGGDDELGIVDDRVLLREYIESAIPDAVVMLASKGYEVNVKDIRPFSFEDADVEGMEFISLISAKDGAWKKTVTKLTDINSDEFIFAQNEFTAPGVNNPIVYMQYGMLSSIPYQTDKTEISFNKKYSPEEGINAATKEATAVCYVTAAIVMGIFGDDGAMKRLNELAIQFLE